ncbi:peptidase inhibitor family I36 protein [Streptomyces liangshanensis]|uniref:peptidase inhibitor family I36 protein n=1 Tax=Streptomyces liangshanensis TaxID=2717324 RepID=UPI0036D808A1
MSSIRSVLAGMALVAVTTLAPTAASAQATLSAASASPAATGAAVRLAAPDGHLYAWEHAHAGGAHCRWSGHNGNWAGCRNKISDVWNNGYPGSAGDVRLFYGVGMTGSWFCLKNGHSIPDLRAAGWRFTAPGPGQGQFVNDNVSSHDWVRSC